MTSVGRNEVLRKYVLERDLKTRGFRLALREFVEQWLGDADLEDMPLHEAVELEFGEFFGTCRVVPAAYKIERRDSIQREGGDYASDYIIHVYEIEWGSHRIPADKLWYYADCTDRDGPEWCLHLINRFGAETVFGHDDLISAVWDQSPVARSYLFEARLKSEQIEVRDKRKSRHENQRREREQLALEICEQLGIKI